jgi:hypothetical protein
MAEGAKRAIGELWGKGAISRHRLQRTVGQPARAFALYFRALIYKTR